MPENRPGRKVTIVLPSEDFQALDHHAAQRRRSKNAILLAWLGPQLDKLKRGRPPTVRPQGN